MRICASAPGKLVVSGEYAVLDGAPALVLAVDRRVHVELAPSGEPFWQVVSPTLGLRGALRHDAAGWAWDGVVPEALHWVARVLAGFAPAVALAPQCVTLDSADFYAQRGPQQDKLGLGSSTALVVALLGALHRCAGLPAPPLEEAMAAHSAAQGGSGSGVGVAAALLGGLLRFQLQADGVQVAACSWPAGVHWRCVDAGRPTSTRAMLAAVAAGGMRAPHTHAHVLAILTRTAGQVIADVCADNAAHLLRDLERYAGDLEPLGELGGVAIVSAEHAALAILARRSGCVYKSCGAGGGDTGIVLATDARALTDFSERAESAGYPVLDLGPARQGLRVQVGD